MEVIISYIATAVFAIALYFIYKKRKVGVQWKDMKPALIIAGVAFVTIWTIYIYLGFLK